MMLGARSRPPAADSHITRVLGARGTDGTRSGSGPGGDDVVLGWPIDRQPAVVEWARSRDVPAPLRAEVSSPPTFQPVPVLVAPFLVPVSVSVSGLAAVAAV